MVQNKNMKSSLEGNQFQKLENLIAMQHLDELMSLSAGGSVQMNAMTSPSPSYKQYTNQ
jgi:hypothetical protein